MIDLNTAGCDVWMEKNIDRGGRQISLELSLDQGLQHICHLVWYVGLTWSATASQSRLIVYLYWPKLRWQFLNSTSSQLPELSLSWLGDRAGGKISHCIPADICLLCHYVNTRLSDKQWTRNAGLLKEEGKGLMHQAASLCSTEEEMSPITREWVVLRV